MLLSDKSCNIDLFDKFSKNIFDNIKIKINTKDVENILNYPVLCYLIYYTSCQITKQNKNNSMWFYPDDKKNDKFNPVIHKMIIHSLIDLINTVIESYSEPKHNYIYDVLSMRFFDRINTIYKEEQIMDNLRLKNIKKLKNKSSKETFSTNNVVLGSKIETNSNPDIIYNEIRNKSNYKKPRELYTCTVMRKYYKPKSAIKHNRNTITNLTNCESGHFHKWEYIKDKDNIIMKCNICNVLYHDLELDEKLSDKIRHNYKNIQLTKRIKQ